MRRRSEAVGLVLAAVIFGTALLASVVSPNDPSAFVGPPNEAPSTQVLLGTDRFGRDIFSRLLHGARLALAVAGAAAVAGTAAGFAVGTISGLAGGWPDELAQRVLDALLAFPPLLLLMLFSRLVEPTPVVVSVILAIVIAPGIARVTRSATLVERGVEYIEAARATGASEGRIMLTHLAPAVLPIAVVAGSNVLGGAIIAEASLAFLGLEASAGAVSWGADVASARAAFPVNLLAVLAPGSGIVVTVLMVNFVADAVRDRLDRR